MTVVPSLFLLGDIIMHPDKDTLWYAATSSLGPYSRKAKQTMYLSVCMSVYPASPYSQGEREVWTAAGGEGVVDAGR